MYWGIISWAPAAGLHFYIPSAPIIIELLAAEADSISVSCMLKQATAQLLISMVGTVVWLHDVVQQAYTTLLSAHKLPSQGPLQSYGMRVGGGRFMGRSCCTLPACIAWSEKTLS